MPITSFGLSKFCRSTRLLDAMSVHRISDIYTCSSLDLLRSHFANGARGRNFYAFMLRGMNSGHLSSHDTLVNRCHSICSTSGISLFKYILDDSYYQTSRSSLRAFPSYDGITDTISQLLSSFTTSNRTLVQSILFPF